MTMYLSVYFRHIVWGAELPVGMSVLVIPQEQFACHSIMHLGSWKSIFQRTLGCISLSPFVRRENRRISTLASTIVCRHSHLYDSYKRIKLETKKRKCNEDTMLGFKSVQGIHKNYTLERQHSTRNCTHAGWIISWIWNKWLFASKVHRGVRHMRVHESSFSGNDPYTVFVVALDSVL